MIKESKLKNKSRKIIKKYGKNNNKNLRHKKTVKNSENVKHIGKPSEKSQKGGEVKSLTDFDYDQLSISKYINKDVDWGSCPGVCPKPNCTLL
jgi:hypothetical protein